MQEDGSTQQTRTPEEFEPGDAVVTLTADLRPALTTVGQHSPPQPNILQTHNFVQTIIVSKYQFLSMQTCNKSQKHRNYSTWIECPLLLILFWRSDFHLRCVSG